MDFITIELRRSIQSCNVFIHLKQPTLLEHVQILLDNQEISLKIAGSVYPIHLPSIRIIPASLSGLKVHEHWIIFRVQSAPLNLAFGTFSTEFVGLSSDKIGISENINLPPKNTNLNLVCNSCKTIISQSDIVFEKILPLPSDDCEPAEWFCCTHGNQVDYKNLLCPQVHDFFYGSHFSVLNKNLFSIQVKFHEMDIKCAKCLATLGVTHDNNSFKFWNYTIGYKLTLGDNIESSSPLIDFKLALKNCIFNDISKEILFIATENSKQSQLLVKPMDKNLSVFIESSNIESENVILEEKQVLKVLYNSNDSKNMDDKNFKICRISLNSLMAGTEYLVSSSKRIPLIYRFTDDYCIGYVM